MPRIQEFIRTERLHFSTEWADRNPNIVEKDWPTGSSHWRCQFRRNGRQLTVYFSMGPAHTGEPQAADVLDTLASDASTIENAQSFEEWAAELGYDADSRKAERTYRIVQKQADGLKQLLGETAYEQLLWHTERE